ncbi:MAG: carboxypeptidase-like regulatory domain-containing protein [Thermoprotei archaeon]
MNKHTKILAPLALILIVTVALAIPSATAAQTSGKQIKMDITVKSLDGYPVQNAVITFVYSVPNLTSTKHSNITERVGPLATNTKGQVNTTVTLNESTIATFNVSYDSAQVAINTHVLVNASSPQQIRLSVNVVNLTYYISSPHGGTLSGSKLTLNGEPGTNLSNVHISTSDSKGSTLVPTGEYNVSAQRQGAQFYSKLYRVTQASKNLSIQAPLLALKYGVVSNLNTPIHTESVVLLSGTKIVETSSESNGTFTGLLPGSYQLVGYGDGLTNTTTILLGANRTFTLRLPVGYSLNLRVAGAFGAPLSGYLVSLRGPVSFNVTTDASGLASFSNLPRGQYVLWVYHNGVLVNTTLVSLNAPTSLYLSVQTVVKGSQSTSQFYAEIRLALGVIMLVVGVLIGFYGLRARKKKSE